MNKSLILFVIGVVFGGGIGFVVATGSDVTLEVHDHSNAAAQSDTEIDHAAIDHAMMHDIPLDVPAENAPRVQMTLIPDPMAGYNLHVEVDNFAFSPENASGAAVPGQGHAHVYINGEKLSRLYGEWMYIASLPKGSVTVEVTLNGNDHRPLALDGRLISTSTVIHVD